MAVHMSVYYVATFHAAIYVLINLYSVCIHMLNVATLFIYNYSNV